VRWPYTAFGELRGQPITQRPTTRKCTHVSALSVPSLNIASIRHCIHPDEWLLPEMFKACGYATAGIGKWHLGTVAKLGPMRNGFDEWLGIPYSNDHSKFHPVLAAKMPPVPLYDGEKIIELDPDQSHFTQRFTERAVWFNSNPLNRNRFGPSMGSYAEPNITPPPRSEFVFTQTLRFRTDAPEFQ
jgi:hypothetical protein